MVDNFITIVLSIGASLMMVVPKLIVLGACFAVLTHFWSCNPGPPWWRNRELLTDLGYWFVMPLIALYLRIGFLIAGGVLLFGIRTPEGLIALYENGHGPFAHSPLWLQIVIYLVGWDLMMYGIHRAFHGPALWNFHAIHHSSKELDWISASRIHPVNLMFGSVAADVVLLLAGIPLNVLVLLAPINIAHAAFVHANLNWTLGPFRYVIAGPVFHRWHHTAADEGGEKNFAPTFPIIDVIFGTFHMPKQMLPASYGVADRAFPSGFWAQMIYPLKR